MIGGTPGKTFHGALFSHGAVRVGEAVHNRKPHGTAPHRTAPHRTAPHRTATHRNAPQRTATHRNAPQRTVTPKKTTTWQPTDLLAVLQ